jgi:hypothetical protein
MCCSRKRAARRAARHGCGTGPAYGSPNAYANTCSNCTRSDCNGCDGYVANNTYNTYNTCNNCDNSSCTGGCRYNRYNRYNNGCGTRRCGGGGGGGPISQLIAKAIEKHIAKQEAQVRALQMQTQQAQAQTQGVVTPGEVRQPAQERYVDDAKQAGPEDGWRSSEKNDLPPDYKTAVNAA